MGKYTLWGWVQVNKKRLTFATQTEKMKGKMADTNMEGMKPEQITGLNPWKFNYDADIDDDN